MDLNKVVERGQVVFANKFAKGPKINRDLTLTLKKPLALLVLGGTDGIEWDNQLVDMSLMSLGLFYADDIAEVLGEADYEKLKKAMEKKYNEKEKALNGKPNAR